MKKILKKIRELFPGPGARDWCGRGKRVEGCGGGGINHSQKKHGFTLIEVVIASTIFTIVGVIGVTVFVNIIRIQRRITLENAIYEDGRFMMERLVREIRENTVDYEEYYRDDMTRNNVGGQPTPSFGQKYGCYASRFFNPGTTDGDAQNDSLGTKCNDALNTPIENSPGCAINKNTIDKNTGVNPYLGNVGNHNSHDANASCDNFNNGDGNCIPPAGSINPAYVHDKLFLIDGKGAVKTFFALKKNPNNSPQNESSLAILKLVGKDENTDGIVETWVKNGQPLCSDKFDCVFPLGSGLASTLSSGAPADLYKGFVPISPLRTEIVDLKFYVSPIEDPRKAFNESDPADAILQQPHVTVVMNLKPSRTESKNFAGDPPVVTLQTTVSSRVYNEVKSFLGKDCGSIL